LIEELKKHGLIVYEKTIREAWWEKEGLRNVVFIGHDMCVKQDSEGKFWHCSSYNLETRNWDFDPCILYCPNGVKKREDLNNCFIENY